MAKLWIDLPEGVFARWVYEDWKRLDALSSLDLMAAGGVYFEGLGTLEEIIQWHRGTTSPLLLGMAWHRLSFLTDEFLHEPPRHRTSDDELLLAEALALGSDGIAQLDFAKLLDPLFDDVDEDEFMDDITGANNAPSRFARGFFIGAYLSKQPQEE